MSSTAEYDALDRLVSSLDAFLAAESKTDRVMPETMRNAYLHAKSVLAFTEPGTSPAQPEDGRDGG